MSSEQVPTMAAPAAIKTRAPLLSISLPMNGATAPMASAASVTAIETLARDQPRSVWIGFRYTVKVFTEMPKTMKFTTKQAATIHQP